MKTKENYFLVLGAIVTVGFVLTLLFMLWKGGDTTILSLMVGALVSKFGTIIDYGFGSSKSSASKDETIGNLIQNAPDPNLTPLNSETVSTTSSASTTTSSSIN
jgi:hypothetical protein